MCAVFSPVRRPRSASISSRTGASASAGRSAKPTPAMSAAICRPARRPKTSRSTSEFVPSRFAPWTLTQAHSPAAYSPGTTVLAASRMTRVEMSVGMPPIA